MNDINEAFESPLLLLARAQEHIDNFRSRTKAAFDPQRQFSGFTEVDPETKETVMKMRFSGKVSPALSAIANDVVYNLRSALDHAVYASVLTLKGGDPKKTKFPFGDTEADFEGDMRRDGFKDVPAPVADLIRLFKPFETGNPTLWSLNKLRNRKGHKVLAPVGIVPFTWRVEVSSIDFATLTRDAPVLCGGLWDARKNELTMARVAPGASLCVNVRAGISVAIYGIPGLETKPAVDIFECFAREVSGVVGAIEVETARLLAIGAV